MCGRFVKKKNESAEAKHNTQKSFFFFPAAACIVPPRATASQDLCHRLLIPVLSSPSASPAVHFGEVGVSGSTSETKGEGGSVAFSAWGRVGMKSGIAKIGCKYITFWFTKNKTGVQDYAAYLLLMKK